MVNSPSDLSPKAVAALLSRGISASEAAALAAQLSAEFGTEGLATGVHCVEETTVLWGVRAQGDRSPVLVTRTFEEDGAVWAVWEAPQPEPRPDILASAVTRHTMTCLGDAGIWVATPELPNFTATAYRFEIGGRHVGGSWVVLEHFPPHLDCLPQEGVPRGTVTEYLWESSVFPGTLRGYWVYLPAQYDPAGPPAHLVVFQDGGMYLEPPAPVPTILDNLIHKGELPVTVGLFINPGTFRGQPGRFQNRSLEYDTLSDQYARFLRDEMLPQVRTLTNLRDDAASHAIVGMSSGAVCAFTVAWEMPELFGNVICHVGSFTNIRGASAYPDLLRRTPRKPLRVVLQDGSNDIDDVCGNWFLANQQMAAALKFRGYDYRTDWGRGFHSLVHGGVMLPAALRWVWREKRQSA
jgi:enterochelin esterase-like enzyme